MQKKSLFSKKAGRYFLDASAFFCRHSPHPTNFSNKIHTQKKVQNHHRIFSLCFPDFLLLLLLACTFHIRKISSVVDHFYICSYICVFRFLYPTNFFQPAHRDAQSRCFSVVVNTRNRRPTRDAKLPASNFLIILYIILHQYLKI